MQRDTAIIEFQSISQSIDEDLEVPLDITANDLIKALNEIYHLDLDNNTLSRCSIKLANPFGLISGGKVLGKYGVRNGTIAMIEE